MGRMKNRTDRWWGGNLGRGAVMLAMMVAVMSGCITPGRQASSPGVTVPSAEKEPAVARLEKGGEGFVIRERPQLDGASRRDFERAVQLLNDQEYSQASDLLEKVVATSPGVTAPYINLALAYLSVRKPEQAETHLKTALELVPDHPVACNLYGILCRKSGRFDEARQMYEKATASYPEYYPVHRNLGILCDLYLNDLACALDHYKIYSDGQPEDQQVKLWIADLRNRIEKK